MVKVLKPALLLTKAFILYKMKECIMKGNMKNHK